MTAEIIQRPDTLPSRIDEVELFSSDKVIKIGASDPLTVIVGPCVIESREHALEHASEVKEICARLELPLVFKASYDKANRTSISSFRGPGLKKGLEILAEVKEKYQIPVISDVHLPEQIEPAAKVLDILQIPAFLCRQTDLLVAAAKTSLPILIKKGQFLAPGDMQFVCSKVKESGNSKVLLCERGSFFGYRDLTVDFRSLSIMRRFAPVVFDATHSVQQMGGAAGKSGGQREFIESLARAAIAVGIDALFLEVHRNPKEALSDAATQLPLAELEGLLKRLKFLHQAIQNSTPLES